MRGVAGMDLPSSIPATPANFACFSMSGICFPNSLGYLLRMTVKMTILYRMGFPEIRPWSCSLSNSFKISPENAQIYFKRTKQHVYLSYLPRRNMLFRSSRIDHGLMTSCSVLEQVGGSTQREQGSWPGIYEMQ